MELKNSFAQDSQGNVIPEPVVHVYLPGTTTYATGLKNQGGIALSNPFTGELDGKVSFAAPDGDYDVKISGGGRETTVRMRFIDSVAGSAEILRNDLASNAAGKGAELIAFEEGSVAVAIAAAFSQISSVEDSVSALSAHVDDGVSDLASTASGKGSSLVGYRGAEDVKEALDARLPEVVSYAALDAYTGDLAAVYVRGVANVFDGGHGVFRRTTETPSAANGIYRQDALGRWWKREGVDAIDLAWEGVDATGGVNSTAGILRAVQAAISLRKKLVVKSGTYLWDGIYISSAFELHVEGDATNPPTFVLSQTAADASSRGFRLEPSESRDLTGFSLAVAVKPNQRIVQLASVTGLSAGMMLQISSNTLWYHDPRGEDTKGELHLIESVDAVAKTVRFTDQTRDTYDPATETITIRSWTPSRLVMKNLVLEAPATTAGTAGVQYSKCIYPQFENVYLKGQTAWGILGMKCWQARYTNIHAHGLGLANSNGYGIQDKGGVGTIIDGLYTWGCRRAVDFHGLSGTNGCVSRDWQVSKFVIHGGGAHYPDTALTNESYGLGMHGPTEGGTFRDGIIMDCIYGINCRSRSITIDGVMFGGRMFAAVSASFGTGLTVRNCTTDRGDYPNKLASFDGADTGSGIQDFIRFGVSTGEPAGMWGFDLPVVVENNVCKGLTSSFMKFYNDVEPAGIVQRGNKIQATPGSAGTFTGILAASAAVDVYIKRSYWEDLDVQLLEGSYLATSSSIIIGYSTTDADRATKKGPGAWELRINDDSVAYIRSAVPAGRRILASLNADSTGRGIFALTPEVATLTNIGGLSASFVGTATGSSLSGTTGVDGNVTIGLMNNGDLWIENRSGVNRTFRVAVLG